MREYSFLIGGKAGEGINQAGAVIAELLNQLGYRVYMYYDYPSLIRGGHNFSIVRASQKKITTHREKVDFLLALNADCIELHGDKIDKNTMIIYDSDSVSPSNRGGLGAPLGKIIKDEKGQPIMRNSCMIGALCKAAGIGWDMLEQVFKKEFSKDLKLNLRIARRGFDETKKITEIKAANNKPLPLLTGNEAIGQALVKAGVKSYIAYPMTPASSILHYLAGIADKAGLKVIHPESEIAVILMALGFSYCGRKTAVGTSGGGFCLMTEGLSLAGMAELPVVIVVSQRPGPSTGVPTYTAQGDLNFVLNAGHGEFTRFVAAPGDAEEAFYWSEVASNIAWKYQVPSIILSDKALSEGTFSFDRASTGTLDEGKSAEWDNAKPYKRYADTQTGVSPMAFPPLKDEVIKATSYEHDEHGITTENIDKIKSMQDKRLRKERYLIEELENLESVKIHGDNNAETALVAWGSNKGVSFEAAERFNLKVVQPIVLAPFPEEKFRKSLKGVKKIIVVENNVTGQMAKLISGFGAKVDCKILKYNGRPFSLDELEEEIELVL